MSGGELAVVLVAVAVIVAVVVLAGVGVVLIRAVRELRNVLSEIRRDVLPAVARLEEASGQVSGDVRRVGGLLDVAERVSERADVLSRATYRALVEPLSTIASLFRRRPAPEPTAPAGTSNARRHGADTAGAARTRANRPSAASTARIWADRTVRPGAAAAATAGAAAWGARRKSLSRRAAGYVVRAGYRAVSARIAAGLSALAQRVAAASSTPSATADASPPPPAAAAKASAASTSAGAPAPAGPLAAIIGEVTREVSAAVAAHRAKRDAASKPTKGSPD